MNSVMVINMNKYLLIIAIIFIIISVVAGIYCKCLQSSVERIKAESSSAIERLQSECAAMADFYITMAIRSLEIAESHLSDLRENARAVHKKREHDILNNNEF